MFSDETTTLYVDLDLVLKSALVLHNFDILCDLTFPTHLLRVTKNRTKGSSAATAELM